MAKKKTAIAKSAFVNKNLDTALERIAVASAAVEKAVTVRARDAKKHMVAVKRLTKRKAALTKRKKLAAARLKKTPGVENRKALRAVEKELGATVKELEKAKATKTANASELSALKLAQRRTRGYNKGIAQVDRALPQA